MFNLLPLKSKLTLHSEYLLRRTAVALWFVAALFLSAALSLIPALFLVGQKEIVLGEQAATLARHAFGQETALLEQKVAEIQLRLDSLSLHSLTTSFVTMLGSVAQARAEGISLARVLLSQNETGAATVAVDGEAENRAALVAFQKALQGLQVFDLVELPVSNLAKDTRIPFSLSAVRKEPLP